MTVTGAVTAGVANTPYTAPFKATTIYAPLPSITGTVTSATSNPTQTGPAGSLNDAAYAWSYLQSHMMSYPSYRWTYLLWMVLALMAIVYALAHHLRLSGGSLGAAYAKWGMRRHTIGSKKPGGRGRTLPSNSILTFIALIFVVSCAFCVIGADYVNPSSSVLDFSTSFRRKRASSSPSYTIQKSYWTSGSRFGFIAFALTPLVVLFALKSPPFAVLSLKMLSELHADKLMTFHRASAWLVWLFTTVHVVLWTLQLFYDSYNGRAVWFYLWGNYRFLFGCVAYGCMCGVMVLSLRPIRKHGYEFFYIAHVVTVFLTIVTSAIHHPVLWYWMAAALILWFGERAYRFVRFARINAIFSRLPEPKSLGGRPYSDLTATDQYEMKQQSYDRYEKTLPNAPGGMATGASNEFGTKGDLGYYDEGSLQPLGAYDNKSQDHGFDTPSTATFVNRSSGYFPVDPYDPNQLAGPSHGGPRSSIGTFQTLRNPAHQNEKSEPAIPVAPPVPAGYAQAQLLPSRTVRLTIRLPRPFKWSPGQSVLLYLPELSKIQSHPFTILNAPGTGELILLVKARKGLTRKLFDLVRQKSLSSMGLFNSNDKRMSLASMQGSQGNVTVPPIHLRAWVDGPHGSAGRVNWGRYSTVLIICGGSGVSFGAAVCDWVVKAMANRERYPNMRTERVRFCWVAREYAEISWIANQLHRCTTLLPPDQLQISIFVTNTPKAPAPDNDFALPRPGFAGHSRSQSVESNMSDMSPDPGSAFSSPVIDLDPDQGGDNHQSHYADVIDLTNYEDEEDVNDPAEQGLSDRLQQQGKVRRAKSRKATKRGRGSTVGGMAYPPAPRQRQVSGQSMDGTEHGYPQFASSSNSPYSQYQSPNQLYANPNQPYANPNLPYTNPNLNQSRPNPNQPYAQIPRNPSFSNSQYHPQNPFQPNPHFTADSRRNSYRSIAESTYARYDPFSSSTGGPAPSPGPRPGSSHNISRQSSMFFQQDNYSDTGHYGGGGGDTQSIAGSESARNILARTPRTQSMVLLEDNGADPNGDAGLWIDQADYGAMGFLSELAKSGKPRLGEVVEEEVRRGKEGMIVATCGPVTLNTVVRNIVSRHISPGQIRRGDMRGHIAIYSEDYES